MERLDSRRLTGPNLVQPGPGAIIDVALGEDDDADALLEAWTRHVRTALDAVGWTDVQPSSVRLATGLCLAHGAPVDALYAATEINEWAYEQARRELAGEELQADATERLRAEIDRERNPAVVAITEGARARGVACLRDDDEISVGLGKGARCYAVSELPADIPWAEVHDIPVALVTGTNGKSTTVRMLIAIVTAAGLTPGSSSTDHIEVGGQCLETGDWSGPGGARRVLREPEVDVAILETARGGILRRGLGVERAPVAVVTNVAADHLGEWGVSDVRELAQAKLVVHRAAERLVLNADDPLLTEGSYDQPVTWFSRRAEAPLVVAHIESGGDAVVLDGSDLVLHEDGTRRVITTTDDVPATLGGAAGFNVHNALAAIGAARRLGLSDQAIAAGLRAFRSSPEDNPGRLNVFEYEGARVLVDFAHNPHGLEAVLEMCAALDPERLLVIIGQAGDRDDDSILGLARVIAAARPDRVIVKEMERYLRGRPSGEVLAMLVNEFEAKGVPADALATAPDELAAVKAALEWSRPGDLLLLTSHAMRTEVIAHMQGLAAAD